MANGSIVTEIGKIRRCSGNERYLEERLLP